MRTLTSLALAAVISAPGLAFQDPAAGGVVGEAAVQAGETQVAVLSMLGDVESNLYRPEKDGLRSLSFELRFEDPAVGHLATARASWTAEGGTQSDVEVHDFEIPPALVAMAGGDEAKVAQMKEMMRSMLPGQISVQLDQIVDVVLNRSVQSIRDDYVGSMAGVSDDGLVKLKFTKRPGGDGDVDEQVVFVDDSGTIQRVETVQDMGMGPKPLTVEMNWKPALGADSGLVLESSRSRFMAPSPFGGEMEQSMTMTYGYKDVDGITILENVTMSQMGQTQTLELEKLVVNGKAADGDAPAEG